MRTGDLDAFEGARIGRRGCDDGSQRPGLEFDRRCSGVFYFDAIVGSQGSHSADGADWTHEPQKQIDAVDGLVHQRPSTV